MLHARQIGPVRWCLTSSHPCHDSCILIANALVRIGAIGIWDSVLYLSGPRCRLGDAFGLARITFSLSPIFLKHQWGYWHHVYLYLAFPMRRPTAPRAKIE